ncbi:MAG: hypothetical protein U5K74_15155 [Gemmatimonadaceae bacterium]|nr:hypothetical protein [Gemmatimonadaceae bacterium]
MVRYGSYMGGVLLVAALSGCLRRFVPAPAGTPLDEVCNPLNGALSVPLDTISFGRAQVVVTKGWTTRSNTAQDLELGRIDAELNVWRGNRFVFPAIEPRSAVRCSLARGDTTISIQATRLSGFNYRVDVSWDPPIDGQYFYMQLQTRYVEHLRQIRGMIEAVRFPVDTAAPRR